MSILGRGKAHLGLISSLIKEVRYPGKGVEHGDGRLVTFNTLVTDQLYPLSGLDNNPYFYIRQTGWYNLYFEVRQPSNMAPGVGWTNGWSGTGSGGAYIWTNRYGSEGLQSWGPADQSDAPLDHWLYVGPLKRYLYAGDHMVAYTNGGATGWGVFDWDAKLVITKLRS